MHYFLLWSLQQTPWNVCKPNTRLFAQQYKNFSLNETANDQWDKATSTHSWKKTHDLPFFRFYFKRSGNVTQASLFLSNSDSKLTFSWWSSVILSEVSFLSTLIFSNVCFAKILTSESDNGTLPWPFSPAGINIITLSLWNMPRVFEMFLIQDDI